MATTPQPLSLEDQCLLYLVGHLETYPPEFLALLPIRHRRTILQNLPAVDICQLEGTLVADGIDVNEDVWKSVWNTRMTVLVDGDALLKSTYAFMPAYAKPLGQYKEYYFQIAANILLKYQSSKYMLGFNLLFSVPACLGITCWENLENSLAVGPSGQFNHPIPARFNRHVKTLGFRSYLMNTLIKQCHYLPSVVCIDCELYTQTELWQTRSFYCLLKEFLQKVRHFKLECFIAGCDEEKQSEVFLVPAVFLEAILTGEYSKPHLKSLTLRGCDSFVAAAVVTVASFFSPLKSFDSLTPVHLRHMKYIPYSGLESLHICVSSFSTDGSDLDDSNEPYMCIEALIHHQVALTEVHLSGLYPDGPEPEKYSDLISTVASLFKQPHFCKLTLEEQPFRLSELGTTVAPFLQAPCSHQQELTFIGLQIDARYPPENLNIQSAPFQDSLEHKKLQFLKVEFKGTLAPFCTWVSQLPLSLKMFGLDVESSRSATDFAVSGSSFQVKQLKLRGFPFTSSQTFASILQSPVLQSLSLSGCNIVFCYGLLSALTEGILRQASIGVLEELDLSNNELGRLMYATFRTVQDPLDPFDNEQPISETPAGSELMPFFNELFKLPQLSRFSLNLDNNEFTNEHVTRICNSWKKNARGCCLWQLSVAQNDCAETVCELTEIATKVNHECMFEHNY